MKGYDVMKIAVDLGHGIGQDRGAVGFIREEEIINSVGTLVVEKLKKKGHTVYEVRPTKSAYTVLQSLNYRTITSNSLGVNLYISIHANAGGGEGVEIYTFGGQNNKEASKVLNNIVKLGFKNRGIKDGSRLYVVRHTNARAMLIEVCFVDNKSDVDKYKNIGAEAIAEAIVNGIVGEKIQNNTAVQISQETRFNYVKRLQQTLNKIRKANLVVDGIAGPLTLDACPLLLYGSTGDIVKLLQQRLVIDDDGIFGPITKKAVMNFQKSRNLLVDGIVGKNTWTELLK